MRNLVLAVVAALIAGPVLAQPVARAMVRPASARPDWVTSYAMTPEGGILRGNPRAAVKIVEYGAITCSHCRAFQKESEVALVQKYLPSGRVSIEFRHFLLNPFDLAGVLLVTCQNARNGAALVEKFYRQQDVWTKPYQSIPPAEGARISALPPEKQPGAIAAFGGLAAFAGMAPAVADRCLADTAQADRLITTRKIAMERYKITGTPGFLINGVPVGEIYDWRGLEPKLQAALKP